MPQNKITFGLRNVHYAIANQDKLDPKVEQRSMDGNGGKCNCS